jgi:hypothetical protein
MGIATSTTHKLRYDSMDQLNLLIALMPLARFGRPNRSKRQININTNNFGKISINRQIFF